VYILSGYIAVITLKTQIIEPCDISLELLSLVRSGVLFLFFYRFQRGRAPGFFCCVFSPYSKVGNPQLHSTRFNYLSFYGKGVACRYWAYWISGFNRGRLVTGQGAKTHQNCRSSSSHYQTGMGGNSIGKM